MVMLNEILLALRDKLESVLQAADPRPERWVELCSPNDADGSPAEGMAGKLLLFVVSLQSQQWPALVPPSAPGNANPGGQAPLAIEASIVVAANFPGASHAAGLELVSHAISFLHATPVLTRRDVPGMPDGIDRLTVEFASVDFDQLAQLQRWTGLNCFPILLYRIRGLNFGGPEPA